MKLGTITISSAKKWSDLVYYLKGPFQLLKVSFSQLLIIIEWSCFLCIQTSSNWMLMGLKMTGKNAIARWLKAAPWASTTMQMPAGAVLILPRHCPDAGNLQNACGTNKEQAPCFNVIRLEPPYVLPGLLHPQRRKDKCCSEIFLRYVHGPKIHLHEHEQSHIYNSLMITLKPWPPYIETASLINQIISKTKVNKPLKWFSGQTENWIEACWHVGSAEWRVWQSIQRPVLSCTAPPL